jgi:hypothetical protein
VSLSIQSIRDARSMKLAGDVEVAIGKLPSTLRRLYDIIYDQLSAHPECSRRMDGLTTYLVVQRTFIWILCAQAHLSTVAFISAIWIPDRDQDAMETLSRDQVLDACSNLVVHYAIADTFRFAHLSVREYLETRLDFNPTLQYGIALSRCFKSFDSPKIDFGKRNWDEEPFTVYARDNLVHHYRRMETTNSAVVPAHPSLPENTKVIIETAISECCFENCMWAVKREVGREAITEVKRYQMK